MANKPIPWTEEEIKLLNEKYPISRKSELIKLFPNRSYKSISGKAEKTGLKKIGDLTVKKWTEEEINILIDKYSNSSREEILNLLPNRMWSEIQHKSSRLNVRKYSEYKEDRHIWTEEEIEQMVLDRDYKYHGTYFDKFNKRKISVECNEGIIQDVYFDNFKNGSEVGSRNITRRKTFLEAVNVLENEGYTVVSNENNYINSKSQIDTICPKGHDYITSFNNFNSGARCQQCWFDEIGKNNLLSIEYVIKRFLENGYIISKIDTYNGIFQEFKCHCIYHENESPFMLSYEQVVHRNIKCPHCIKDERKMNYKKKYTDILNFFTDSNLKLYTSENEYIEHRLNIETDFPLIFECNEHSHLGKQQINARSFRFNNNPCRYCVKKQISGENHYRWQGGISPLSQYLRGKINQWKFDSMKHYDFKCFLTGKETNLIVHHIKPFRILVRETLNEAQLPLYENISKYTDQELKIITDICIKKHYESGFGVCLNSDVHNIFHDNYSVFHFTETDFYDFVERYNNGEFEIKGGEEI